MSQCKHMKQFAPTNKLVAGRLLLALKLQRGKKWNLKGEVATDWPVT